MLKLSMIAAAAVALGVNYTFAATTLTRDQMAALSPVASASWAATVCNLNIDDVLARARLR